jgi:hypothetical protein
LCTLGYLSHLFPALSQTAPVASETGAAQARDGQHDFDFNLGAWKTHISRLQHPLAGSTTWIKMEGTVVVRKVWDGRAQLEEVEADGSTGRFEGLTLFLYNPQAHQWSMNFSNSNDGTMGPPSIGEFKNGRGEFFDQESFHGRTILVRVVWSDITPDSHHFEQAFSDDGGKTWEPNFTATLTREKQIAPETGAPHASTKPAPNDFDFEIGTWKTHLSRLQHPLSGSTAWVDYEGTTVVRSVWNGRANLLELDVKGPSGHIEALSLRLYNPESRQWSLNFAGVNGGTLSQPTIGEFKNGRGEFFDQEAFNGRTILVRFVISDITADSCHFEQSFSADGGKTWELNWVATDTRVKT